MKRAVTTESHNRNFEAKSGIRFCFRVNAIVENVSAKIITLENIVKIVKIALTDVRNWSFVHFVKWKVWKVI